MFEATVITSGVLEPQALKDRAKQVSKTMREVLDRGMKNAFVAAKKSLFSN